MTLSHCWGNAECLKLTVDNYAQMLDGIPLLALPQLYQDAVCVVRRLGIRYLWIDSLCIIQEGDGHMDWAREVHEMDKVYSNSLCNISASDSSTGHHTMFRSRVPHVFNPAIAHFNTDGHISSYLISNAWVEEEVDDALVDTRGWVLQERLLSPRIVHFSKTQIHWECREEYACELYPDKLPGPLPDRIPNFKKLLSNYQESEGKANSGSSSYVVWHWIVGSYAQSQISFPSDKLVALSAVAKVMRSIVRDGYIAGMWRSNLSQDLLWSVTPTSVDHVSRPDVYRAPSWSWVAVEGSVMYQHPDILERTQPVCSIVDVELLYSTDDDTGPVEGGFLRLRGVLKPLSLVLHYRDKERSFCYGDVWSVTVDGTCISVPSEWWNLQPRIMFDPPFADSKWQDQPGSLYFMSVRASLGGNHDVFILLFEVIYRERGIYRRIGFGHGWGQSIEEALCGKHTAEVSFPCEKYEDGLYTIRVI
jgi:hypothetical protein